MNADDFRDYMLAFLFLRYLSDNYESAVKKELGKDYPKVNGDGRDVPLALWYAANKKDVADFEKQMRRKVHYVIKPGHLWASIANMARRQDNELLKTLQEGFKYIENESFQRQEHHDLQPGADEHAAARGEGHRVRDLLEG
jgi:type I restriction enzyme M protein